MFIFGNTKGGRVFSPKQDDKEGILQHDFMAIDEKIPRRVVDVMVQRLEESKRMTVRPIDQ